MITDFLEALDAAAKLLGAKKSAFGNLVIHDIHKSVAVLQKCGISGDVLTATVALGLAEHYSIEYVTENFELTVRAIVNEFIPLKTPKNEFRYILDTIDRKSVESRLIILALLYQEMVVLRDNATDPKNLKLKFAWYKKEYDAIMKYRFNYYSGELKDIGIVLDKIFDSAVKIDGDWYSCLPKGGIDEMAEEFMKLHD